jgi:hypothetical protein
MGAKISYKRQAAIRGAKIAGFPRLYPANCGFYGIICRIASYQWDTEGNTEGIQNGKKKKEKG